MPRAKKPVPPIKPKPSTLAYEPFMRTMETWYKNNLQFLEDMRNGTVTVNPRMWGVDDARGVYNKVVDVANYRAKVLRNWREWVKLGAPVFEADDKEREVEDVSDPSSFWYEPDLDSMKEDRYYRVITQPSGKWRKVISLRGKLLIGDPKQLRVLRKVFLMVMEAYIYAHGFTGWDKFGIIPKEGWEYRMGAFIHENGIGRVIVNK